MRSAIGASRHDDAASIVAFTRSPFPLVDNIQVPGTSEPFFRTDERGRFHVAPRGGTLYETGTYDDPRSLVVVPKRFDATRPAALVLFFHGNLATLDHDVVRRQRVIEQFERSGLNAVLLAPQLAVNALDSSPGRFYEPHFLDAYLDEAAQKIAERSDGRLARSDIDALPLVLAAYSGGYLAAAYSLPDQSLTRRRIAGVILLDALFGEEDKFAQWIREAHADAFFISAYSASSAPLNDRLRTDLERDGFRLQTLPRDALKPGDIVLLPALGTAHNDFVTEAWTHFPLQKALALVERGLPEMSRQRQ